MNQTKVMQNWAVIALFLLSAATACVESTALEDIDQPCFTKESLETVPWIVDELKPYSDPRMGGYYAAVYIYDDKQFLAIMHPFDCSPIGHVFNCAGVPLDSLDIDVRDFSDRRRLAVVLAELKF